MFSIHSQIENLLEIANSVAYGRFIQLVDDNHNKDKSDKDYRAGAAREGEYDDEVQINANKKKAEANNNQQQ